jgi:hypothetical protein
MKSSEDNVLSILPHPDDADFLEELRELAFLAAKKFDINLKSVAHKAMPSSGVSDALCYESRCFIRLVLRFKDSGKWHKKPLEREQVLKNLGWCLPSLLKKRSWQESKPRVYMKKIRQDITDFLLQEWQRRGSIDRDEVLEPVI